MTYCYGLTDVELEEYREELSKLDTWFEQNEHLRDTKEWNDNLEDGELLNAIILGI